MVVHALAVGCAGCQQTTDSFRLELENLTYFVRSLFGIVDVSQGGQEHVDNKEGGASLWRDVSK